MLDGLPVNGFDFPSWEVSLASPDCAYDSIQLLAILPGDQQFNGAELRVLRCCSVDFWGLRSWGRKREWGLEQKHRNTTVSKGRL